jgi:hypothetical protein
MQLLKQVFKYAWLTDQTMEGKYGISLKSVCLPQKHVFTLTGNIAFSALVLNILAQYFEYL